jgi:predicted RNA-binding Zn-ribbon protein involved in translation (DUF1610 family)
MIDASRLLEIAARVGASQEQVNKVLSSMQSSKKKPCPMCGKPAFGPYMNTKRKGQAYPCYQHYLGIVNGKRKISWCYVPMPVAELLGLNTKVVTRRTGKREKISGPRRALTSEPGTSEISEVNTLTKEGNVPTEASVDMGVVKEVFSKFHGYPTEEELLNNGLSKEQLAGLLRNGEILSDVTVISKKRVYAFTDSIPAGTKLPAILESRYRSREK